MYSRSDWPHVHPEPSIFHIFRYQNEVKMISPILVLQRLLPPESHTWNQPSRFSPPSTVLSLFKCRIAEGIYLPALPSSICSLVPSHPVTRLEGLWFWCVRTARSLIARAAAGFLVNFITLVCSPQTVTGFIFQPIFSWKYWVGWPNEALTSNHQNRQRGLKEAGKMTSASEAEVPTPMSFGLWVRHRCLLLPPQGCMPKWLILPPPGTEAAGRLRAGLGKPGASWFEQGR